MQPYVYRSQRVINRQRKKAFQTFLKRTFFSVVIVGLIGVSFHYLLKKKVTTAASPIVSPLAEDFDSAVLSAKTQVKTNLTQSTALQSVVQAALAGTQGSYGIEIKNLKTGEVYTSNADTVYDSASLYKLWIMAVAFQEIQAGKLSESQTLTDDVEDLNKKFNIDDEDAEQTSGTISYTVHDALHKMITISDNYAALLLTAQERLSNVSAFLQDYGFNESKVGVNGEPPITTPSDVALFFEKLYSGQLANKQYTDEMVTLLQSQALNEKIPKYLPEDVVIAHKTGELDEFSHDAGVVYAPSGNYIIVVMTKSDSPPDAIERIAEVSKNVYNYFENNPSPSS